MHEKASNYKDVKNYPIPKCHTKAHVTLDFFTQYCNK